MKRISVNIFLTYSHLFRDLAMWGHVDPYESERDINRIVSLIETRGERSVFIDFPSCAKSLDYALSRGVLDVRKLAILGKTRNGLPEFMNSVFAKVFDGNGRLLREDIDVGAVKALRQVLLLYKKVQIPCSEEKIRNECKAFFSLDRSLRSGSMSWSSLDFDSLDCSLANAPRLDPSFPGVLSDIRESPLGLLRLSQRVCDQIVRRFDEFSPDAVVGNHGPGAVADSKCGMDKYVFPTWSQQLERVFPRDLHASPNIRTFEYGLWGSNGDPGDLRTLPARLIPVAKTQEKPRLIASEPTANQFIQGGIRKFLRKMIESGVLQSSIAISDQSLSRDLALLASMDNSIATVDLSNASDRLSTWTVERVFRKAPRLLEGLAASRSQYIVDDRYTKQYAMLRKYAPQGNATVFPLQSIVYCCFAIAASIWSSPGLQSRSDAQLWRSIKEVSHMVRVFGDDIILPNTALPALSSLLELCQLSVNGAKSHFGGRFAESCGMDAFMGTDVTPVYMASVEDEVKPGDVQSAVDISNDCYKAGLLHLGNLVIERVPEKIRSYLAVSRQPGPTTLLFTYSSGLLARQMRVNSDLHRPEYRTLVSLDKSSRVGRDSWESLLQYFIESPSQEANWQSGWNSRIRTKLVRRWVPVRG